MRTWNEKFWQKFQGKRVELLCEELPSPQVEHEVSVAVPVKGDPSCLRLYDARSH